MRSSRFPIRIGARSRLLLRVGFGVTKERAWVSIDDALVVVRMGWFHIEVPIAQIRRWRIEGPWPWITAIGVRRSLRRGDISFMGSPRGGVRLELERSIRWSILEVPALYVGVEDLEAFAAELSSRGIPGEDARSGT